MTPAAPDLPPGLPDGAVRCWGAVDSADWARAYRLLARTRTGTLRWIILLLFICYLDWAVWLVYSNPPAGAALITLPIVVILRWRRFRGTAIRRAMEKSERTGGSPYWIFEPAKVSWQAGLNDGCFEWPVMLKLAVNDEMILLMSTRLSFNCIPARFFQPADYDRVVAMARAAGLPVRDFRKKPSPADP